MSAEEKYMVGLPIINEIGEWGAFLQEYGGYIHSIYFSLPLGDRFHSRSNVRKQFHNQKVVDQFWQLLDVTRDEHINLEMVLNMPNLSHEDLVMSKEVLDTHGIPISMVTICDKYYDEARSLFPKSLINYSFNNYLEDTNQIPENHKYDEVIIGRKNIRNLGLLKELRLRGMEPVLLLNNGCNHYCRWCGSPEHCGDEFSKTSKEHSIDELYAYFSMMPFEMDEKIIKENFRIFKISNRNSDVGYTSACMDSYINRKCEELITDTSNYFLWARLAWFPRYYDCLDFDNIMRIKRSIYDYYDGSILNISKNRAALMLLDEYVTRPLDLTRVSDDIYGQIGKYFKKDLLVDEIIIGSLDERKAIVSMNTPRVCEIISMLRNLGVDVKIAIPWIDATDKEEINLTDRLIQGKEISGIITMNQKTANLFSEKTRIWVIDDDQLEEGCGLFQRSFKDDYITCTGKENVSAKYIDELNDPKRKIVFLPEFHEL